MQDISLDRFAVPRAGAAFGAHDRCRLVDDYPRYTKLEKIKGPACSDAEDLARQFNGDAAEQARMATEERRVEITA